MGLLLAQTLKENEMNLTNDIILEFSNGYFEVQHKKVVQDSGKAHLSEKKTFATLPHLEKYLAPYSEAGIKAAKQGLRVKERALK